MHIWRPDCIFVNKWKFQNRTIFHGASLSAKNCYVDEDASCLETKPSTNSEFHWTCEACNGEFINQSEVFFTFVLYLIIKNKRKRTQSQSGVGKSDQKITGGVPTTKEQCTTVEGEVILRFLRF